MAPIFNPASWSSPAFLYSFTPWHLTAEGLPILETNPPQSHCPHTHFSNNHRQNNKILFVLEVKSDYISACLPLKPVLI